MECLVAGVALTIVSGLYVNGLRSNPGRLYVSDDDFVRIGIRMDIPQYLARFRVGKGTGRSRIDLYRVEIIIALLGNPARLYLDVIEGLETEVVPGYAVEIMVDYPLTSRTLRDSKPGLV